jgi:tetratricopeptide (TPR) repeat protein
MIYISDRVYEDIKNKQGIVSGFVEEKMLKNIDHPVKIYAIDAEASSPVKRSRQFIPKNRPGKKTLRPSRRTLIGSAIAAIVLAAASLLFFWPKKEINDIPQRIVVAVFENHTGDPTLDELGKMACDWIVRGLSQTNEIEVVPSTTVMQIYGMYVDPGSGKIQGDYLEKLAKETMSQIIVSGSYYIQNESLQFNAEVKNALNGKLIYSMPVLIGAVDHSMELIAKVSSEIVGGLAFHFQSQEIRFVSKPPSKEAYSEYITGLEYFGVDYEKAIVHFNMSVKFDSLFFQPRFFMASSFSGQGEYFKADSIFEIINRNRARLTPFERSMLDFNMAFVKGNYVESLHFLQLAEGISPGDRTVNYVIGLVEMRLNRPASTIETYSKIDYFYSNQSRFVMGIWRLSTMTSALHMSGSYEKELTEARRGQQLFPDIFWFYESEVRALAALGKIKEIESVLEKCKPISSKSDTEGDVIMVAALELRAHGHLREAENYAVRAVDWFRTHSQGTNVSEELGAALYLAGNYQEARTIFQELAASFPGNPEFIGYLGVLAARMGDKVEASRHTEALREFDKPHSFGRQTYWRACIASLLGEPGEAVDLLNESFAQGNRYGLYIHQDIDLESLRTYEPFLELIKPKE